MDSFVAIDTETTGTDARKDVLLEVAAVRFRQGQVQDKFVSLVDPGCLIPAEATAINGITDQLVKGAPKLPTVLQQFSLFCGSDLLVAHRASFDHKFLSAAFLKHKVVTPTGPVLDTLNIVKQTTPGLISYRLSNLINHFGIVLKGDFHRAELDALGCGLVFVKLVEQISLSSRRLPLQNLVNLSGGELYFPKIEPEQQLGLF